MKPRTLCLSAAIFFLLVNTTCFWQKLPGHSDFVFTLALVAAFFVLLVVFGVQLIHVARAGFRDKAKTGAVFALGAVLTLSALFPRGLIKCPSLDGPDLMVARLTGVAGCSRTFTLKTDGRFAHRSVCFGVDETLGRYEIKGDTIWFKYDTSGLDAEQEALGVLDEYGMPSMQYYVPGRRSAIPFLVTKFEPEAATR